ncbi:MAG TPA: fumarylacetoacetate hydrolase family protein [Verrucomicrobiae bacterium]|nr:fumarylacetoacetate hydrolase family protein [Verrucomicrobiae bacterium]
MKLCKFVNREGSVRLGCITDGTSIIDVSAAGVESIASVLDQTDCIAYLRTLSGRPLPRVEASTVRLLAPVDHQEIWAAGVTYLRSKKARMEESEFSATAYDRVYEAERPELFFKCLPEKAAGPGEPVGIRADSKWSVPEPELALVINSRGKVAGYTIGNDMSSRDIEGENLLYLPQAKIYEGSCALGPWIQLGAPEPEARRWAIALQIRRNAEVAFKGETSVGQIKRRFDELAGFLFRSQSFRRGAVLLTGTGIVPPDGFTLAEGDEVQIEISGIGALRNPVKTV